MGLPTCSPLFPKIFLSKVVIQFASYMTLTQIYAVTVTKVFAETRGDLLPDPRYDAIGCIVVAICEDRGTADNVSLVVVLIRDKEAHTIGRYNIFHDRGLLFEVSIC